jgi:DNA polymerase III sliding clamp (beta) subunit (PCNA family)
MMAYNDRIGISLPFRSEFKGAIPGALAINWLKASKAEPLEFSSDGRDLVIKAASAKLRLAMIGPDAFVFTMPKMQDDGVKPLTDEFLDGLSGCMRSVSTDGSVADQLGITIIPEGRELLLFSTNNHTLSYVRMPSGAFSMRRRTILPAAFCEQLLALAKDDEARLVVTDKCVQASIGDVMLYGRLIESAQPLDFRKLIDSHIPNGGIKKMIDIPTKLEHILMRATILTEAERTTTKITVRGDKMDFYCRSDLHGHEYKDVLQVKDHPQVEVSLDSKLLQLGYGYFDKMLLTDRCAIMAKDQSFYMVAAR